MDGRSTDGSLDLIREYCDKYDFARYVSSKDEGMSDALNKGFAMAKGTILGWLNSDDRIEPDALATISTHFADDAEPVLYYGRIRIVDKDGKELCSPPLMPFDANYLLKKGNYVPQPSAFFRKDVFDSVGGLDKSLEFDMDYDLWLKFIKIGHFKTVDKVLSCFRLHPTSKTCKEQWKPKLAHVRIAMNHGAPIYCKNVREPLAFILKDPFRKLATRLGLISPYRCFLPKGTKLD